MRYLALVCLLAGVCAVGHGDIPVIGLDDHGNEVMTRVPKAKYAKGVVQMLTAAQEESIPALERLNKGKKWKVATVTLGIGLDLKFGISPFFELGIAPRFRAHLCSTSTPIIP